MIVKFIIEACAYLGVLAFNLINGVVPHNDFASSLLDHLDEIIHICTQACNCLYFIVGDSCGVLIPLIFGIFSAKILISPILRFVIGFIHWGG